jgi:hypothetical protein
MTAIKAGNEKQLTLETLLWIYLLAAWQVMLGIRIDRQSLEIAAL